MAVQLDAIGGVNRAFFKFGVGGIEKVVIVKGGKV